MDAKGRTEVPWRGIEVLGSYGDVDPAEWDALVGDGSPFLEHAFLAGLEDFECAVPMTGWGPRPVLVREDDGRLVAASPGWLKGHSMGEFVYDHSWAHAAERAGIRYYPKLIAAVPFTPVTGSRLLVHPDEPDPAFRRKQLAVGLNEAARDCAGLHLLFDTEDESEVAEQLGMFERLQFQFHWQNRGYATFEDWLADGFKSKQRNKVRRERRDVAADVDVEVVTGPDTEIVDALHGFYTNTCRQFGPWGRVYLNRDFFRHLADVWAHRLHAVVARTKDGQIVGGAFNVQKGNRLYGRYWGCSDQVRFLHFEVCYYAPVEWSIAHGIDVFEPGHGGGHKYRRGFLPVITRSNHRLRDPRLHAALEDHARREADHVRDEAAFLTERRA